MPEEMPSHPTSDDPASDNPASATPASATRFPAAATVIALLAIGAGAAGYAVHERNLAQQLADQNSAVTSTLNTTRDQMSALNTRLDAMTAERAAEKERTAAANSVGDHPAVYRKGVTAASIRHRVDDPRWKKFQGQLDDQAKQIDSTRQDLSSARTELQGSIATTHDELVLLEKKGERSYFEFDLDKRGQMQREGPVAVRLRKANTKREYADLELMVDDFKVSKNHVNIYEPVVFYSSDRKVPVELVINSIAKNHIHGYVSEPKYKGAELEAMATSSAGNPSANSQSTNSGATNASGTQTAPAEKPSAARQQLAPPQD